jgi:hypothetical protein
MKLGEIKDMSRYLENDCYCTGEIYDPSGFFYRVYDSEMECTHVKIGDIWTVCIVDDSILAISYTDGKIDGATRIDATKNNVELALDLIESGKSECSIDEFVEGSTVKAMREVLSFCDAVMVGK